MRPPEFSLYLSAEQADAAIDLVETGIIVELNDAIQEQKMRNEPIAIENDFAHQLTDIEGKMRRETPTEEIIDAIRYGEFLYTVYEPDESF